MSVYRQKDRRAFTYDFQFRGRTYKGNTGQITCEDAQAFEDELKRKLRRQAGGLVDPRDAPYCQEWAGVYYEYSATKKKVKRPERIDELNQVVLRFFGRAPTDPAKVIAGEPYHNLKLSAPIVDPKWLDDFEDWMVARGVAGSTRNHYRSTVSGWYRVAMLPRYRKITGISLNPMVGVPRDRRVRRNVDLEPDQILAWIEVASYHVRLAMAIAALAPKLRMASVLALEWKRHLDRGLTRITVDDHKTDADTGEPVVVMVSEQLRGILQDARRRNPGRFVVSYRSQPVKGIRTGVAAAAARAGLHYGLKDGVTFHTIRHAVSTLFAQMTGLSEPLRAALMAQSDIATTQGYTHLRPVHELAPLEQLSATLPIAAAVTQPWRRWSKKMAGGEAGGPPAETAQKPEQS